MKGRRSGGLLEDRWGVDCGEREEGGGELGTNKIMCVFLKGD